MSRRRTPIEETSARDPRGEERRHRRRQPGHTRPGGRVEQELLHQQGRQEDEREEGAEEQERGEVRGHHGPVPEHGARHQGRSGSGLDPDERRQQQQRPGEQRERARRRPAVVHASVQAVHEQQETTRHRGGAERVEPPRAHLGSIGGEEARRQGDQGDPDGDVDEEHPAPPRPVGQQAARDHTDRRRGARDRAEDPEGPVPLSSFREGHGQDRERRRRHEGGPEPLERARPDQQLLRLGQAGQERGAREQREPRQEDPASAEQVAQPAAQEQEATQEQAVRDHHPLQRALVHVELPLDRGQGHVHDRDVEDHHELRRAGQGEDQALPGRLGFHDSSSGSRDRRFLERRTGGAEIDTRSSGERELVFSKSPCVCQEVVGYFRA